MDQDKLPQAFVFPNPEAARAYLERRRWPDGPKCPVCDLSEPITQRRDGYYRCNHCKEDFTVRTGTIFERSHVPLHKWLQAIGWVATIPDLGAHRLSNRVGVTKKSAWSIQTRLTESCGVDPYDHTRQDPYVVWHRLVQTQRLARNASMPSETSLTSEDRDIIVDRILAYQPKARSWHALDRKRRAAKLKRAKSPGRT